MTRMLVCTIIVSRQVQHHMIDLNNSKHKVCVCVVDEETFKYGVIYFCL